MELSENARSILDFFARGIFLYAAFIYLFFFSVPLTRFVKDGDFLGHSLAFLFLFLFGKR